LTNFLHGVRAAKSDRRASRPTLLGYGSCDALTREADADAIWVVVLRVQKAVRKAAVDV
jgi:hypothetical protein